MSCVFVAEVCKGAAEVRQFSLDLGSLRLSRRWEPSAIYDEGDVVRPTDQRPSGFEFVADNDGQSNIIEPNWKASTVDGSITWSRAPISNASLRRTISTSVWTAPVGITITASSVESTGGRQVITVRLSGGTVGATYLVTSLVTYDDGQQEQFGLNVEVH
jgi:hypothetical protein